MTATHIENDATSETADVPESSPPIIFFDGVCGLCNRFVDFVMKRDKRGVFRFATLQGETAEATLPEADTQNLASVALVQDGKTYRKSAAVVRVLWKLNWWWKVLGGLFWVIPFPLRDLCYKGVAKIRYKLFGKRQTCRMPSPEERARFLD